MGLGFWGLGLRKGLELGLRSSSTFLDLGRFNIHCAGASMVLFGCFRLFSGVVQSEGVLFMGVLCPRGRFSSRRSWLV